MDRDTVEALIQMHMGLVKQVASRCFSAYQEDQDLLQCGLIGLWEAAETWTGKGKFPAYARVCINHNMLDYIRSKRRERPTVELTEQDGGDLHLEDAGLGEPDMVEKIKAAWPPNSRERLILLALHTGVSKQAIAAAQGLNTYQVTRIAKRAVKKLQTKFGKKREGS